MANFHFHFNLHVVLPSLLFSLIGFVRTVDHDAS